MQGTKNASKPDSADLSPKWWESFLSSGAFLRLDEDRVLLWSGPFERVAESEAGKNKPNISIAYMNFFDTHPELRWALQPLLQLSVTDLIKHLGTLQSPENYGKEGLLKSTDFRAPEARDFEKTIQLIMGKIQRGEIEKAVPAIFARTQKKISFSNQISWMIHLLQTPLSLNAFGFWENEIGIMGATPEVLFHREADRISSMALAGTMPRKDMGLRNSLLKDPKELHEHQVVVKDIETQLGKWGWVKKSTTKILELPTLLHLQTLMHVDGVRSNLRECLQQLHPTPALGVSPRAYGYQWLSDTSDQIGRRLFGGPIVFNIPGNSKDLESNELALVAIRNIQWDSEGCRIGAGCGVVKESKPEQEWQELQQKLNSVMLMLGIKKEEES